MSRHLSMTARHFIHNTLQLRLHRYAFLAWLATILFTQIAFAHDYNFVVSRDNASPPRLYINGPSNYLDGTDSLDLIPGDGALEGFMFNDAPGFSTLKQDGSIRQRFHLRTGHRIALRLLRHDPGVSLVEASTWKPVIVNDGDTYEFFLDEQGDFNIQMIARLDRLGTHRATFQFVDLAGLHADSAPFTLICRADKSTAAMYLLERLLKANPKQECRIVLGTVLALTKILAAKNAPPTATLSPDGHYHVPGKPLILPTNYRAAVAELRNRLHDIDGWIISSKFCNVPPQAEVLRTLATLIPRLAAMKDSGVPDSDRENLVGAASEMSAKCDALIVAANWSDPIGVREHYQHLYAFLEQCEKFVPRTYICPMGCEADKTYPKPGKCPDCGMNLSDTRAHTDHQSKHGGTFFMASDYLHHLEGTLTTEGEFRVYFYDEYTKPLTASVFTAQAEIWGPDEKVRKLSLRPADSAAYLSTGILKFAAYPLRIKLLVDFRDGKESQRFDFDFTDPQKK